MLFFLRLRIKRKPLLLLPSHLTLNRSTIPRNCWRLSKYTNNSSGVLFSITLFFFKMGIRDLYGEALDAVCRVTEQKEGDVMHSNKECCVDARAILVNVLINKGLTEGEISSLTGLTQQCVNKLKNNFSVRKRKWSVTMNLQCVDNELTTS